MVDEVSGGGTEVAAGRVRMLAVLLAMTMFVLVVDTSLMNVSISAVVRDLDTTASGVQSAIAWEALVSACGAENPATSFDLHVLVHETAEPVASEGLDGCAGGRGSAARGWMLIK